MENLCDRLSARLMALSFRLCAARLLDAVAGNVTADRLEVSSFFSVEIMRI